MSSSEKEHDDNPNIKMIYDAISEIKVDVKENKTNIKWLIGTQEKLDRRIWYIATSIILTMIAVPIFINYIIPVIQRAING